MLGDDLTKLVQVAVLLERLPHSKPVVLTKSQHDWRVA
jgi:hypothetical protein